MTQVLLAEDDPAIAEPLARALGREGYDVRVQGTGQGAIDGAAAADLVVLDLGLPDMDGLDVARAIRNLGLTTPLLVASMSTEAVTPTSSRNSVPVTSTAKRCDSSHRSTRSHHVTRRA